MGVRIGQPAPDFSAQAIVGDEVREVSGRTFTDRWIVIYFYPKDDTSVCASENEAFRDAAEEFEELGAQLLAVSADSLESHRSWRDGGLGPLPFPWIADEEKDVAEAFGALHPDTGLALRATVIIDPDGMVRYVAMYDLPVGRSVVEILRCLKALQSGKPTRCNWRPGEPTL